MVAEKVLVALALVAVMAGAVAQVPANATSLNPSFPGNPGFACHATVVLQRDDVVHVIARAPAALLHARSLDGGRTWPMVEQVVGPMYSLAGAAFVAGALLVLGYDPVTGPFVYRSTDDGMTWSLPIQVAAAATPQPMVPWLPTMHVDGSNVVVAWTNDRGNGRVWANRSIDGGVTWMAADTRLDLGLPPYTANVIGLRMVGEGPIVHVFWNHVLLSTYSLATAHQVTLNWGQTWQSTAGVAQYSLLFRATGGGVTLLLSNQIGPHLRSTDLGATWSPMVGLGMAYVSDLVAQGTQVLAVGWSPGAPYTYVVNTSSDSGATWQSHPLLLPNFPAQDVEAHVLPGELYVRFFSALGGSSGLVIHSDDVGQTWHAISGPVRWGFSPGERRNLHLTAAGLGQSVDPLFAYVGVGYTVLGIGTAGSGGSVPRLVELGLPLQGQTTVLQVDQTIGSALGVLGLAAAPPVPRSLGTATIWVDDPVLMPFVAAGGVGQAGVGHHAVPLAVPVTASLAGAHLVGQALVLDAGAAAGFAVTNAIEMWLR